VTNVRSHSPSAPDSRLHPRAARGKRHAADPGRDCPGARLQVRQCRLRALQRKGVIDLLPGASRGIQLKDTLRDQIGLPLIGRVAAGRPIMAEENIEARFQVDSKLFHPKPHYLLKVQGMSMKDVGILDGDLVAVHRTPEVRNRQIVVARIENEVTVKRYRQEGSVVWLLPENADFEPIRVDLKEQSMLIEGVVVGVLRRGNKTDMLQ
jgi:repressor LexA